MTPEDYDEWTRVIQKAASAVASDFHDIDPEDLEQDLWVLVLQQESLNVWDQGVASLLKKMARKQAWEYRKEQLQWTSQYTYRTSDIRMLLEYVYDQEAWGRAPVPTDAKSMDKNKYDVYSDISWGISNLPNQYKEAIEKRYRDLIEPETRSAESQKLYRAVRRLADTLNFYRRPGMVTGSRKVLTNEQARSKIREQDGSYD